MKSVFFLAALFLVSSAQGSGPASGLDDEEVRILRDPWGVPHILAESDYGALYGHGWALAEDQLVNALNALWTVQGRRTEIDGPGALGIDRTMRLMRIHSDIEDAWDTYDEEFTRATNGFSDGINAWMAAHPDKVPDWAEPVQPSWCIALGRVIDFIPQIRRANGKVRNLAPHLIILRNNGNATNYERVGSNAWALAPSRMKDGQAVMLTDPHLPWLHEFRLYESHMRGRTFECAGASFVGVPLPQFARNANVAWGWTWNGPDHADVYRLTLDPEDSGRYLFDGESLAFDETETVYRMPDGTE
ncbi:MAG: penicillin acylase family protein, partial [Phycisphaerales bacterium]|nr:penicillin acylase family protein [Phycisphaerales bacterium]